MTVVSTILIHINHQICVFHEVNNFYHSKYIFKSPKFHLQSPVVHEYPLSTSAQGKAAKKNQKRAEKRAKERAQKLKEDGVIDRLIHENEEVVKNVKTQDPVERLKTELQEAKDNKVCMFKRGNFHCATKTSGAQFCCLLYIFYYIS